jgi:hypothetical protein
MRIAIGHSAGLVWSFCLVVPTAPTGTSLLAALLMAFVTPSVRAADGMGRVMQIAINRSIGPVAFIKLETAPTGSPACATNNYWHFTLPLNTDLEKRMHATLLGLSGRTVNVGGTGTCGDWHDVESVQGVGLL